MYLFACTQSADSMPDFAYVLLEVAVAVSSVCLVQAVLSCAKVVEGSLPHLGVGNNWLKANTNTSQQTIERWLCFGFNLEP